MAAFKTRLHLNPRAVRQCVTYKVSYDSRDEALYAAERAMERNMVKPGCHVMPNVCPQCGRWHIANKTIVSLETAAHVSPSNGQ